MKTRPLSSLLLAIAVGFASTAEAHHSFAALYDATKPIRLVGTLKKIDWTNPHSFFHIDVKGSGGQVRSWAIEGAGPGALSRRGFKRGDIKIGDTIIVQGYLAKSGARLVDGRLVTLPDGRIINGGTPGDGGPGDTGPRKPAG